MLKEILELATTVAEGLMELAKSDETDWDEVKKACEILTRSEPLKSKIAYQVEALKTAAFFKDKPNE